MDELFDRIIEVARTGISILMVEQNARQALEIADIGCVSSCRGANAYTPTPARRCVCRSPEVRRTFLWGLSQMDIPNALITLLNFVVIPGAACYGRNWR